MNMKKKAYQVRIFFNRSYLYSGDRWAETALAQIIRPTVRIHRPKWFWFSRYNVSPEIDGPGADLDKIPDEYYDKDGNLRSIRFRFQPTSQRQYKTIRAIIESHIWASGGMITEWEEYDPLIDLGSKRFTAVSYGQHPDIRAKETATNMVSLLHELSNVILDALAYDSYDDQWKWAHDPVYKTKMVSPHHLICNMTGMYYDLVAFHNMAVIKRPNEKWYRIVHKIPGRLIWKLMLRMTQRKFG